MASKDLKTGWKRIGRSGPAVDGREINPEMIEQAAANYNKELFTALIWPEHFRYINLGTVEALRVADNEEGGKDLFAMIAPNQFYLQANSAGQKLFTSMELTPDFRKTGQWYLTGLGATDDPASAATTEMRLSASAKPGVFLAKAVEHEEHTFNDQQKPSFFEKLATALFSNTNVEDEDMADKAAIEKLKADMDALDAKFAALKTAGDKKPEDTKTGKEVTAEEFSSLVDLISDKVAEKLGEKFSKQDDKTQAPKGDAADDKYKALQDELKALSDKFAAALKEQPGTDAGEHFGSGEKPEDYI